MKIAFMGAPYIILLFSSCLIFRLTTLQACFYEPRSSFKNYLLEQAVVNGCKKAVELLLTHGADPTAKAKGKKLLLESAGGSLWTKIEIAHLLLAHGAAQAEISQVPYVKSALERHQQLLIALSKSNLAQIRTYINLGYYFAPHFKILLSFIYKNFFSALEQDTVKQVRKLHQRGLCLHLKDTRNGNTPLHTAVQANSIQVVDYLLSAGCDVTKINNQRQTALDLLCDKKNSLNQEMLMLFLDHAYGKKKTSSHHSTDSHTHKISNTKTTLLKSFVPAVIEDTSPKSLGCILQ
ncbi:ankyrin repeat domain-containing protein [Candidatus Dependentiae bacterium]|nr:ankyrin repeat domain-containing protein [Candidatus Dependentiae bacterium]